MRQLFWKFWIAISAAIVGMLALTVFVITQWHRFELQAETQSQPNAMMKIVANRLEMALANDGDPTPILLENELSEYGQTYLIDPTGADWLGRPIPAEILGSEPSTATSSVTQPPSIFARAIQTQEGAYYFMIFSFDGNRHPLWMIFKRINLTWILIGGLLLSGLISALLALYVAHPLRELSQVSKQHGRGLFDTEIDANLRLRRDEVGELARQLESSGIKINQALKRQEEFVRDVSHEVRGPLARLQVAAERLEAAPADHDALAQIKREVLEVDDLVQDLLHLSKEPDSTTYSERNLEDVLTERIQRYELLANSRSIEIRLLLQSSPPKLTADYSALTRAFDNLIANAVRHAPPESTIYVECGATDHECRIVVKDSGSGVPPAHLEAIFEPFVRLDTARQRSTGGFGLGLALVKKIVRQHDGCIHAENQRDGGLAVTVSLPLLKVNHSA